MHIIPPEDVRLWEVAAPVSDIPAQVLPLLQDLRRCMSEATLAVALSAPQVGVSLRFFITNGRHLPSVVVNPIVLARAPELQEDKEGCLSFPGKWVRVKRPQWIRVRFFNAKGFIREDEFSGFAARIFLHELDHLDGVCILPRPQPGEAQP